MAARRSSGTLWSVAALAAAALASSLGCGEARKVALQTRTNCESCHGQPPDTDAHLAHTSLDTDPEGIPHLQVLCLDCHENVQSVNQPDHIVRADGTPVPAPAEVRFDDPHSFAGLTEPGSTRAAAPVYDPTTRTCSNGYCHGSTLKGPTPSVLTSIAWDAPEGTVVCGSCHGIPPVGHPAGITLALCKHCHGDAIDATGRPSPTKHVNGVVDFVDGAQTSCAACHGDPNARTVAVLPGDPRSAPPTDSLGSTTAASIGAHQAHVASATFAPPVACSECHVVPATLQAPGHFGPSATVTFGPLATNNGATHPTYDPTTQTCSSVYCHGNFPGSKAVFPPPAPTWNQGASAITCGTCHGLPPPAPTHAVVDVATLGCNGNGTTGCHTAAYTPTTVDPRLHIDGRICPPDCTPATP